MSESGIKERRVHERHDTTVQVQGMPEAGGVVARMVTRNLSLGGLYCTSSTDFPEMTRLAVRLMLPLRNGRPEPDIEAVDVEAVVVRREAVARSGGRKSFDLALFFTNVSETTRDQLRRYLEDGH